jgi:FKBP-type peptidyl-prolyl cis-trans isomerase FklB
MKKSIFKIGITVMMLLQANTISAQVPEKEPVDADEMAYQIGMAQCKGLTDYLIDSQNVNFAFMDLFIKGVKDGISQVKDPEKNTYMAGTQIGRQIAQQMLPMINKELYGESSVVTISTEEFLKGFFDGLDSTPEAIAAAVEKANQMMEDFKIQNR